MLEEKQKKLTTSKAIILFLFINCTLIELFTGYITIADMQLVRQTGGMVDFAPIVTLIGAVIGEVIGYAVYSLKASKENTRGGIVYDTAMRRLQEEMILQEAEAEENKDTNDEEMAQG